MIVQNLPAVLLTAPRSRVLGRNIFGMLAVNVCFAVLIIFVDTFMIARVYSVTGGNYTAATLFKLMDVTACVTFYFLASFFFKRIRAVWVTRTATAVTLIGLVTVAAFPVVLENYYMVCGFVWGGACGLFAGANQFLTAEIFGKTQIMPYLVWYNILTISVKIIFPFTLGGAIDLGGFVVTSTVVAVVSGLMVASTFLISVPRKESVSRRFEMRAMFREMRARGFTRASWGLFAIIVLRGISDNIVLLITVLVIMVLGTNISLGVLGSMVAVTSILTLFVFNRVRFMRAPLYIAAVFVPLAVSFAFLFSVNAVTVVAFQFVFVTLTIVFSVTRDSTRLSVTRYWQGEKYLVESNMFYEFAMWLGRIVSAGLVLATAWFGVSAVWLAGVIVLMCLANAIYGGWLWFWRKRYFGSGF